MKKIIIVVEDSGYFISHRLSLAEVLIENGAEVIVLTNIREDMHRELLLSKGLVLKELKKKSRGFSFIYSFNLIKTMCLVFKQVRPNCIFVVSMRLVFLGLLATLFYRNKNYKFFGLISGLGFLQTSKKIVVRLVKKGVMVLIKWICRSTQYHLIVQNSDDEALVSSLISKDRLFLVRGSGVDSDYYVPTDKKNINTIHVAFVSRMLRDKGLYELIEAFEHLKKHQNIKCILVGDVDNANPSSCTPEELERWAEKSNIEWHGREDNSLETYQEADIAVLPSYREGLPKTLLEAASCGLPIIATDVPGCREICIQHKNGYLVPARNALLLSEAILKLATDDAIRDTMGKESRRRVLENFSLKIINAEMLEILM